MFSLPSSCTPTLTLSLTPNSSLPTHRHSSLPLNPHSRSLPIPIQSRQQHERTQNCDPLSSLCRQLYGRAPIQPSARFVASEILLVCLCLSDFEACLRPLRIPRFLHGPADALERHFFPLCRWCSEPELLTRKESVAKAVQQPNLGL